MASSSPVSPSPSSSWSAAARLVARWLDRHERIDALLDTLPRTMTGAERARCQHLVLGVVRHFGRIDAALARLVRDIKVELPTIKRDKNGNPDPVELKKMKDTQLDRAKAFLKAEIAKRRTAGVF